MFKFIIPKESILKFKEEYESKIKKGGLYLKSKNNIYEGDKVAVVFRIKSENLDIESTGEVGWVDDEIDSSGKKGFLVRGIILSPAGIELLNRTVAQPPPSQTGTSSGYATNMPQTPPGQNTGGNYYQNSPQPQQSPNQSSGYYNQPAQSTPSPQQNQSNGYYNQPPPPPSSQYQQNPQQPQDQSISPNTNISVNVTSPTGHQTPHNYPPPNYDDELRKLKGNKTGLIIFIIFVILLAGGGYWFFGMGGKEMFVKKEVEKPAPPPPQKVIVEVKQVEVPKPEPKPVPKPKPKPRHKKKIIVKPGLNDFTYNTGQNFTRTVFVFNKRFKKYIPSNTGTQLSIYIPNGYNDMDQEQFFLNSKLIRSILISKSGTALSITFYPVSGVVPKYDFDRESDKLIVTFFKNGQ